MSRSDQVPTHSGFDARSTGGDVLADVDLTGRTAVVTGGYSGIGLQTTRALAGAGARVVVAVRSPEKAADTLAGIEGQVETAPLDLSDLSSVRAFSDELAERLPHLDLLINNAGIMACPLERVGPGWESQFGINHMGHFALTRGLLPLLRRADRPRVVCLSSGAHKRSGIRWDDIGYDHSPYDKWQAYGQAKTANALFANALSRRLRDDHGLAFSVHPGGIFTPLQRHLPTEEMIALGWLGEDGQPSEMAKRGFKTPEQGCATTLWAATSELLDGKPGVYCEDCDVAEPTDPASPMARFRGVDDHASDDGAAERLWAVSEDLLSQARW
jgi:NAD(P)-dependent dehydrogenase (short-subunit alcohol dehydrogenase family)